MENLDKRLEDLRELIQQPNFLAGKGLSNEINIRLFCYDPKEELSVRYFTEKLLADKSLRCHLIEHNLYKIFLSICDDNQITELIGDMELEEGKDFLLEQLELIAGNEAFAEKMKETPHKLGDVILITGVGEAFPFIRVHDLLNAMQSDFSDVPVLVMYPGSFDGRYVKLFNELTPNPYYRAFNVI